MTMTWSRTLLITFCGITIVFIVLILLVLLLDIFGRIMNSYSGKTKGKKDADHKAAKAPRPKAVKEIRSTEEKDEILAVIAAAAAYMSAEGINGVVRSVRRSGSRRPIWALAGLMDNTHPF